MSKNETSQVQQDAWTKMTQEALGRMQAFYDEMAALEGKAYTRAKQTSEQLSALAADTLTYMTELAAEWRKVTLEATRRGAEMLRARA